MGQALVTNNAFSTLASNITAIATTLTVAAGTGIRFPTIGAGSGNYFYLSLINTSNQIEVVKVITTATDVFTIQRGQDGTTARAYVSTDRVELRPTAGLINDKVSIGGGTLTGHLNTIAGATGTQVPQVQEVVKITGDTMTGTLTIPSLRGSTSGNIVTIPSGHIIKGTDSGSIVQPGSIIQTVYLRSDVKAVYTIPTSVAGTNGTPVEIDELTLAITPKYNTSKILLTYSVFFEADQDTVILLSRNNTIIGRNSTDNNLWSGLAVAPYDQNNDSTPVTQTFFYLDSPATTSTRTYRYLVQKSNNDAGYLFNLNRTQNAVGTNSREVGISQVLIQEIAQ
jgi:hypothetical protein